MMLKMLIIVFILLEIFSFAKSGEDISHDGYTDKLDNLQSESINAQDSLSSLQFQPSILDFLQRSIGDPHDEKVYLFNKHKHKKVYLGSISGSSTSDFYSSYFEDKVIGPESNTSFKIVFLPRQLGETNSSLIIHTSFGVINYQVRGIGVECQYRLRPLIGIKLPLNATITPEIQLYNPHDFALQISEIYSSGGEFQLELPNVQHGGQEGDYKLWEIPSFTSKPIIRVRFNAFRTGNHTAYVRIKIASSPSMKEEKMLVVPIEIEVYNHTGIFSEIPLLDFGMIGINDGMRRYVYNLLNSGSNSISIKNWGIESDYDYDNNIKNSICLNVDVVQFRQRNFTDHLNVDVDWSKCSNLPPHIVTGYIYLITDISDDGELDEFTYRIPFYGHVIDGNLSYNADDLKFLRNDKKSYENSRSVIVKNQFNLPLAITNLTVPESFTRFFKLSNFKPIILQPGALVNLLEIQPLSTHLATLNATSIEETFRIITNVTNYDISVWSYTGTLRRIVPVDFARERSQIDEKALNFGALLPVGKQSELLIAFVNENPIPIEITSWKGAITSGNGQAQISTINRGCSKMSLDNLLFCSPFVRPGEWIIFSISVQSNVVGTFGGHFLLKSPFEEINTPVKFSTAMGRLELKNKMIFDDCFPGKICSLDVQAYSTFMKKMYVEGIAVDMDGISYEFAVNKPNELPIILPNVNTNVGKLFFNPKEVLCKKRSTCYTSFDILSRPYGETWMRILTNYTEYNQWDNEKLRSQLNSFMDVKQNIKQMQFRLTTSQIRRYEFNASINFIWPRLMKGNVDFPFVQIGKLETRFIEIYNPSDQVIFIHFVMHNISQHGDKVQVIPEALRDCSNCILSQNNPFTFNTSKNNIYMDEIGPRTTFKLGINFFTETAGTYYTLLYLRNNLTVVEAVWLTARAVIPQFKFGNRKLGSTTALTFEINEKHLKLCEKKTEGANVLISSKRTFTAKNFGEVPLTIYGMKVENDLCMGYGFKVLNCEPFTLQPNESKKIEIGFSPDFTLSRVVRTLNFDTSIGSNVNFTLIGTVASPALEICSRNIQRPAWESDFKSKVLIVLCIALALVLFASVIDSDRILKEHVRAMARERGHIQAPLDLRKIGLEANSMPSGLGLTCFAPTPQERLNNLNNHQTSLNNIRKRLTITKNLTALRNKITGTKVLQNNETSKNSPRPTRHEIGKSKSNHENQNNINKEIKKGTVTSEDDSISSSSSKENCEVKPAKTIDNLIDSPPLGRNKNNNKKSKNQLNITESAKDQKNCVQQQQQQKAPVKPLNNNQNQNRSQVKENKNKLLVMTNTTTSPSSNMMKLNGDIKSHSPTSNASSSEGHQQNNHVNYMNDIVADVTNEVITSLKNDANNQHKQPNKYGKIPGRERKTSNMQNNNVIKRVPVKDNKQFTFKQNFTNNGKMANTNNGHPFATNWVPTSSSIWSNTSYSEVVAQPPVETKTNLNFGSLNGLANGVSYRQEYEFNRINSFNRSNDPCFIDQDMGNCTQYGPIGTKKSPSSTPSWEPLNAGINHHHISKPLPYNMASNYFASPQPNFGMQQSKLMNLMSYNDNTTKQQQQMQVMDERCLYIMKMKERQQAEWLNNANTPVTTASSLWSSSNWTSPSPPLSVPPGFEQQYQHQPHQQQPQQQQPTPQHSQNQQHATMTQQSAMPAYDPFKSLKTIWEPNNNNRSDTDRDSWNQ